LPQLIRKKIQRVEEYEAKKWGIGGEKSDFLKLNQKQGNETKCRGGRKRGERGRRIRKKRSRFDSFLWKLDVS